MKNRVQVIVLENERLQQELKSQRQEETLREQTLLGASVSGVYDHNLLFGMSLPTLIPVFQLCSTFDINCHLQRLSSRTVKLSYKEKEAKLNKNSRYFK